MQQLFLISYRFYYLYESPINTVFKMNNCLFAHFRILHFSISVRQFLLVGFLEGVLSVWLVSIFLRFYFTKCETHWVYISLCSSLFRDLWQNGKSDRAETLGAWIFWEYARSFFWDRGSGSGGLPCKMTLFSSPNKYPFTMPLCIVNCFPYLDRERFHSSSGESLETEQPTEPDVPLQDTAVGKQTFSVQCTPSLF